MRIYKAPGGQFVASVSHLDYPYEVMQTGSNGENAEKILLALANGNEVPKGICSLKVWAFLKQRWPRVYGPKTKIQHRKIFKDDSVVSPHSKWHDLDDLNCSHVESEARTVIANGGIVEGGYCLNMFREVAA